MLDPNPKLGVLFFTSTLGGGGAEMHLLRLVNALDRDRFHPMLAVSRGGGSYERLLAPDVQLHAFGTIERSSTASMAWSVPKLKDLIAKLSPTVLCSVMDHANTAALLATRQTFPGLGLILCVQNNPVFSYDRSKSPLSFLIRHAMRSWYRRADAVIALSQGVASELLRRDPTLDGKLEVIPNAASDDALRSNLTEPAPRAGLGPEERLIVACGRLTEQKGFSYLLDAFAMVRNLVPAVLWIVGEGPHRRRLIRRAEDLGLGSSVRFLGFQSNPWKFMRAADVFVLSSIYEGFGNVVVEAMATGVPVVATDCPYGPGEIIADGSSGLLVPPRHAGALADALLRVLQSPQLAARLSANGRRRAVDFEAQTIAHRYGRTILRVGDSHRRAARSAGQSFDERV